tara:strand:+ start:195 stop:647 length:453 start_codon:yes stop_codon:yes gene_type:complete
MSLINDANKLDMANVMKTVHETFARDIKFIKDAKRIILSTDPNYNYLYKSVRGSVSTVKREITEKTFKARILYVGRQEDGLFDSEANAQIKVEKNIGEVRIKVDSTGHSYLKEAKRVELDGRLFTVSSDERPHGLFSPQFYTFYLKPINS